MKKRKSENVSDSSEISKDDENGYNLEKPKENENDYESAEMLKDDEIGCNKEKVKKSENDSDSVEISKNDENNYNIKRQKESENYYEVDKKEMDDEEYSKVVLCCEKEYQSVGFNINYYDDIFAYLKSCYGIDTSEYFKTNKEYPASFQSITNKKKREKKREDFRNKCVNYFLVKCPICTELRLAIRKSNKANNVPLEKPSTTSNIKMAKMKNTIPDYDKESFYLIPFVTQKDNIIKRAHGNITHICARRTAKEIEQTMGYTWYGITRDVENYVLNCEKCVQTFPNRKQGVSGIRIPKFPRDTFQVDLVYVHSLIEKITNGEVKYIMNVIDLFSKYAWSFPLKEKTAYNVAENLNRVFSITPKYLSCDNGKEFANDIIKNLCQNYNIQVMYGMPYDPKSQGSVEAFNKTCHKSLLSEISFRGKKELSFLDIQSILSKFTNEYNNQIHSVTKYKPSALLFLDEGNVEHCQIADNVKNNILKNRKKRVIKDLKINDKCLMGCKFYILKNKKFIAKQRKKLNKKGEIQEYKIPIIIKDIVNELKVSIEICKTFKCYELKRKEVYWCDYTLIKKCSQEVWTRIKNKKKLEEDNIENFNDNLSEISDNFTDNDSIENDTNIDSKSVSHLSEESYDI